MFREDAGDNFFPRWQTCVTSNKGVVHFTSKVSNLSELTGSD